MAEYASVALSKEIHTPEELAELVASDGSIACTASRDLLLSLGNGHHVTSSNTMIRVIASLAPENEVSGSNPVEIAQVDSWLCFLWHSVELPLQVLRQATEKNEKNYIAGGSLNRVKKQLGRDFAIIDKHLGQRLYLVGGSLTVADMALAVVTKWASKDVIPSGLDHWVTRLDQEWHIVN